MRNTFSLAILFLFTMLAIGCREKVQKAENILSIDPTVVSEKIYLSELVDSVSYIRLETNSECIMGRITEIIIKKKYIYALDHDLDIVCVFDKNGQFISKLDKIGKGPGEYLNLGPVFVDENETYIEVLEHVRKNSRRLKYSNLNFELLEESIMYVPSANSCRKLNSYYYFSPQQNDNMVNGNPTNADIIIVDGIHNTKKALFKKNISTEGNYYSYLPESFTVNEKGELFVSLMFNHTFYQLSGWEATPILTVDFGKYSINNSIGRKSTEEQLEFLKGSVSGKAYFPVLNANTDKIMAISYMFGEKGSTGRQYFKLKYKNKIFHTKKIIDDVSVFQERNFICSSSYPIGHEVLYENYLVDIILPWRYLGNKKEIDIDPIGKISDQDNPIILLMKLKG